LAKELLALEALRNHNFLRKGTFHDKPYLYCKICGFNDRKETKSGMWFIKDIQPNLDHNMREHLAGAVHMQKEYLGELI